MKCLVLILAFVVVSKTYGQETEFAPNATTTPANSNTSINVGLFNSSALKIDLKAIDPAKGSFGIDYSLNLNRDLLKNKPHEFDVITNAGTEKYKIDRSIDLTLKSNGFVTVAGDVNPVNSLINELRIDAFPLIVFGPNKRKTIDLRNLSINRDSIDLNEIQRISNEILKQTSPKAYLFANLHSRHETTQDFKNYNFAFGAALSLRTYHLAWLLDQPFKLLRVGNNNNLRHAFIYAGYDYVTAINHTASAPLRTDLKPINRINLKAEWETGIFTARTRIGVLYDSYYEINPPQKVKDSNLAFNRFFMIRLDQYLNQSQSDLLTKSGSKPPRTKVSIKYTKGSLPPNFTEGFVLGAGFSLEL